MKICRFGEVGAERLGIVDADGLLRDISSLKSDFGPGDLASESLKELASLSLEDFPVVQGTPRIGVPWAGMSKFICIGLNYSDHANEANMPIPTEPIIFLKALSALCGPNDATIQPPHSTQLDWEVELGIVIGKTARHVSQDEAMQYIAGYCVVNDISERSFQLQSSQWDKGKGCDTFGPVGPWMVTADEIVDPNKLGMWLDVNGERKQRGNSQTMIFDVATLVSYCSRYMTLMPGDLIATGTPPGVGMGMKPPQWLRPGDVVTLGIDGLGQQKQQILPYQ